MGRWNYKMSRVALGSSMSCSDHKESYLSLADLSLLLAAYPTYKAFQIQASWLLIFALH